MEKICTKCGVEFKGTGYLHGKCSICQREANKEATKKCKLKNPDKVKANYEKYRKNNIEKIRERDRISAKKRRERLRKPKIIATTKVCNKCKQEKSLSKFYKKTYRRLQKNGEIKIFFGYNSHCILCVKEDNKLSQHARKKSYWKHREKHLAIGKIWAQKNKERVNFNKREARATDPEKYRAYVTKYREKNRELVNSNHRKRYWKDPEKYRERDRKTKEKYREKYKERDRIRAKNHRDNLTDRYIIETIKLPKDMIPLELIKLQRIRLQIRRELRNH